MAKKLSLKDGMRVWFDAMPATVLAEIAMPSLVRRPAPEPGLDAAHIFVTDRNAMADKLALLRPLIDPASFVWVSWPKTAAKVTTDISENIIREAALPMGWVDVKVCAVDATWSGLKLVIRRSERLIGGQTPAANGPSRP